jgi:hypothetical protein
VAPIVHRRLNQARTEKGGAGIPWFLLASLAEAAMDEYRRQRRSMSAQLDREVGSLETVAFERRSNRKEAIADALTNGITRRRKSGRADR